MKIELDKKQLDKVAKQTISSLEKEVARLQRQVSKLSSKLTEEQERRRLEMDTSKDVREKVQQLAYDLLHTMKNHRWIDTDYDDL